MKLYRSKMISGLVVLILFLSSYVWTSCESNMKSENTPSPTSTIETEVETQTQKVDQKAVEIFRKSMDYFSNLKQFTVQGQSTLEDILESGHRVDYEFAGSVTVNRPHQLRTERYGELLHQIFYYDGKTLTLYNPTEKVYATESAPGTIDDMFHVARDSFGISVPISDLLYQNSFDLLIKDVNFAAVIGKEMIGEVQCDHLLFGRPDVDFQIWFADNGPPLPYRYIVTDKSTPELLSFSTAIYNWDLNPLITDSIFEFEPFQGISKITFLKPDSNDD